MAKKQRHPITGCRADSLMGGWFIENSIFQGLFEQAMSVDLKDLVQLNSKYDQDNEAQPHFEMVGNVAVIELSGVTTKYPTSFRSMLGGTATMDLITSLKRAEKDGVVQKILLKIDSPGGTAAGQDELVDQIKATNKVKPVYAFISDQGMSAALMTSCACRYIATNRIAMIGSLGTKLVLRDTSGAYKKEGIIVHAVTSGKFKAAGEPGTELDDKTLKYIQHLVQGMNQVFVDTVQEGRGFTDEHVNMLASDAKVYHAAEALELGLVDEICSYDSFVDRLVTDSSSISRSSKKDAKYKPATRRTNMLTAAQLAQLHKIPGASNATEENADQVMLGLLTAQSTDLAALQTAKTELTTAQTTISELQKKVPTPLSTPLAKGHVNLLQKELGHLVKSENLTPAQLEILNGSLKMEDDVLGQRVLQDGTVLIPATAVVQLLEVNKPSGLTKPVTGAQPVAKNEPGSTGAPASMTLARYNELRQHQGLSPVSQTEFDARPRVSA